MTQTQNDKTMTQNETIKLRKADDGLYRASKTIDNIEYTVIASRLDDYKSFGYEYISSKGGRYSDGWYGMRLKDIKNALWSDVVETLS